MYERDKGRGAWDGIRQIGKSAGRQVGRPVNWRFGKIGRWVGRQIGGVDSCCKVNGHLEGRSYKPPKEVE
ncbi:MAG: hypothetical protein ACK4I8_03495 [Armatimonadota bacterium]